MTQSQSTPQEQTSIHFDIGKSMGLIQDDAALEKYCKDADKLDQDFLTRLSATSASLLADLHGVKDELVSVKDFVGHLSETMMEHKQTLVIRLKNVVKDNLGDDE